MIIVLTQRYNYYSSINRIVKAQIDPTRGAIWRTNIQQPGLDSITDRVRGPAPSGFGRSPATKRFLVHFELKIMPTLTMVSKYTLLQLQK